MTRPDPREIANSVGVLSRKGVVIAQLTGLSGTVLDGNVQMMGRVEGKPGFWVAKGVKPLTLDYIVYPSYPRSGLLACDSIEITRYEHPRVWLSGQNVRPSTYVGPLPAR